LAHSPEPEKVSEPEILPKEIEPVESTPVAALNFQKQASMEPANATHNDIMDEIAAIKAQIATMKGKRNMKPGPSPVSSKIFFPVLNIIENLFVRFLTRF
jgi:hypothetical protein